MSSYYEKNKDRIKKNSMKWKKKNRKIVNKQTTERRAKTINILFDFLGRQCVFCGFDNVKALCLDHIDNNGSENRKKFKHSTLEYSYYSKHLDEVGNMLQVLCYNCNMIKEIDRRVYV